MLLPHLVADPDVELIEVVTNTALSAANAVKKFGFLRSGTDQTELLAAGDIDMILIATRHASHAALVCAALRAGKAVFVEKPLAITRESLTEVVRTVEETGNDRVMVGFNRRFSPLLRQLKRDWGKRSGRHTLQYRVNAGSLEKDSWYLRADEGSRFAGEGGHFIDTVSWWLGADPTQIVAAATFGNPDNLAATLLYPDGSLATISYLTEGDPNAPKERIEIFGEGKVACFDNFQRFELWSGGRATRRRVWRLDKGQKAELKAFIAATKTGGNMPIDFNSLATTTAVTLAAQESISANRPIATDHLTGSAAAADVGIR
jgi:predicted dehydrogenase